MITVSKGLSPHVLAQMWAIDLGTRPDMRIQGYYSQPIHDMYYLRRVYTKEGNTYHE